MRAHTRPEQGPSTSVLTACAFRHVGEIEDPEDGVVWRWELVTAGQERAYARAACADKQSLQADDVRMAIEIRLDAPASPDDIFAELEQYDGTEAPASLQVWSRGAARALVYKRKGSRFRLVYQRAWYAPEHDKVELHGSVERAPGGISLVRARVGHGVGALETILTLGALALTTALLGRNGWFLLILVMLFALLVQWRVDARVSRDNEEAAHLAECLERAVAEAVQRSRAEA